MTVSVVMATYNRSKYLERSFYGYLNGNFPLDQLEIIVIDDWSEDGTNELLRTWADRLPLITLRPRYKPRGHWRSEGSVLNCGLRACCGDFIIATHPEIIPGANSIRLLSESQRESTFHVCKTYFLSAQQQAELDTVDWKSDLLNVRKLPRFYTENPLLKGAGDTYSHANADTTSVWESWQFAGMTKETWRDFGGFSESEVWGVIDVEWVARRRLLGYNDEVAMEPETLCVHQNHDDLDGTNRDWDKLLKNMVHYTAETARLNYL